MKNNIFQINLKPIPKNFQIKEKKPESNINHQNGIKDLISMFNQNNNKGNTFISNHKKDFLNEKDKFHQENNQNKVLNQKMNINEKNEDLREKKEKGDKKEYENKNEIKKKKDNNEKGREFKKEINNNEKKIENIKIDINIEDNQIEEPIKLKNKSFNNRIKKAKFEEIDTIVELHVDPILFEAFFILKETFLVDEPVFLILIFSL